MIQQDRTEIRSEVTNIQGNVPFLLFKCFSQMDRKFGTTSEFVILGSSVVSTSVTSSDLLNTTLVSPGNTVKAHRQPIQIPQGSP